MASLAYEDPYTEGKVPETPYKETSRKEDEGKLPQTPRKEDEGKLPQTPRKTPREEEDEEKGPATTPIITPKTDTQSKDHATVSSMKMAVKNPPKPLILHNPPSQEYAEIKEEDVNFLMEKMKAYLYYPKDEADFIRHIERYEEKYQEDLAKWIKEIRKKIKLTSKLGGGKEMHGGAILSPKDLERLALLAIEYKRTIIVDKDKDTDDINELNKKTIGLTLTRINRAGHTEHNVLVQVPIRCFEFNKTQRIQVGASRFEYGILSTRHVYYFNTPELEKWLHDKKTNANYEFPQLGTPTNPANKISNIVFRNNIVEYEVTKKSILEKTERMGAFCKRLNAEEKEFFETYKEHFKALLLRTKNVDKVFVSLRFHPGNRGHIIYTIKQFFKNIREQYPYPDPNKPIIHKGEQVLDRFGVFQSINSDTDTDKQTYGIKDVFTELGIFKDTTNAPLEELDKHLRNGNFEHDAEANKTEMEDLGKQKFEIGEKIEKLTGKQKNLEQAVRGPLSSAEDDPEGAVAGQIDDYKGRIKSLEASQEKLNNEFEKLKNLGNTVDVIKEKIKQLIMPVNSEQPPYTGLWFNLTIPGNHTWILFYVNGQFYSVGGGYNNDREYKLAFYSPDPVFDYANHWLFPLMMNNWGFIDKNIIDNLEDMAESIRTRGSEGFVTKDLKYSLLSNRLSSLCGYYNCASTADKILGQSVPATFSHPSFSRGGEYTYTSQVFEALNIDYTVELALSATERFQHYKRADV
jgi:hypothetical protein